MKWYVNRFLGEAVCTAVCIRVSRILTQVNVLIPLLLVQGGLEALVRLSKMNDALLQRDCSFAICQMMCREEVQELPNSDGKYKIAIGALLTMLCQIWEAPTTAATTPNSPPVDPLLNSESRFASMPDMGREEGGASSGASSGAGQERSPSGSSITDVSEERRRSLGDADVSSPRADHLVAGIVDTSATKPMLATQLDKRDEGRSAKGRGGGGGPTKVSKVDSKGRPANRRSGQIEAKEIEAAATGQSKSDLDIAMRFSALALYNLSCFPRVRHLLVEEGAGSALLALALRETKDVGVRLRCSKILFNLSSDPKMLSGGYWDDLVPGIATFLTTALAAHQKGIPAAGAAAQAEAAGAAQATAEGAGSPSSRTRATLAQERLALAQKLTEQLRGVVLNAAGTLYNLALDTSAGDGADDAEDKAGHGGLDQLINTPDILQIVMALADPVNGPSVQAMSSAILCRLSCAKRNSKTLVAEGGLKTLITLAESRPVDEQVERQCMVALCNFSRLRELGATLVENGAVPALIKGGSADNRKTRSDCAGALCNLTRVKEGADQMAKEGAIAALISIGLVRSADDPVLQKVCGFAIYNLLSSSAQAGGGPRDVTTTADAIWALTKLSTMDEDMKEIFALTACNLAVDESSRLELLRPGTLRMLLELSSSEVVPEPTRRRGLYCLHNLIILSGSAACTTLAGSKVVRVLHDSYAWSRLEEAEHKRTGLAHERELTEEDEHMCLVLAGALTGLARHNQTHETLLKDGALHLLRSLWLCTSTATVTTRDFIARSCAEMVWLLSSGPAKAAAVENGVYDLIVDLSQTPQTRPSVLGADGNSRSSLDRETRVSIGAINRLFRGGQDTLLCTVIAMYNFAQHPEHRRAIIARGGSKVLAALCLKGQMQTVESLDAPYEQKYDNGDGEGKGEWNGEGKGEEGKGEEGKETGASVGKGIGKAFDTPKRKALGAICARIMLLLTLGDESGDEAGVSVAGTGGAVGSEARTVDKDRQMLVVQGGTRVLVALSKLKAAADDCAAALCNLSHYTNTARMVEHGAGAALIDLVRDSKETDIDLRRRCIVGIRNLVSHSGNVATMVEEGVVPVVVSLCAVQDTQTLLSASAALVCISMHTPSRGTLAKQQGIHGVMNASIAAPPVIHDTVNRYSVVALSNLALDTEAHAMMMEAGALTMLMQYLAGDDSGSSSSSSKTSDPTAQTRIPAPRLRLPLQSLAVDPAKGGSSELAITPAKIEHRMAPWKAYSSMIQSAEPPAQNFAAHTPEEADETELGIGTSGGAGGNKGGAGGNGGSGTGAAVDGDDVNDGTCDSILLDAYELLSLEEREPLNMTQRPFDPCFPGKNIVSTAESKEVDEARARRRASSKGEIEGAGASRRGRRSSSVTSSTLGDDGEFKKKVSEEERATYPNFTEICADLEAIDGEARDAARRDSLHAKQKRDMPPSTDIVRAHSLPFSETASYSPAIGAKKAASTKAMGGNARPLFIDTGAGNGPGRAGPGRAAPVVEIFEPLSSVGPASGDGGGARSEPLSPLLSDSWASAGGSVAASGLPLTKGNIRRTASSKGSAPPNGQTGGTGRAGGSTVPNNQLPGLQSASMQSLGGLSLVSSDTDPSGRRGLGKAGSMSSLPNMGVRGGGALGGAGAGAGAGSRSRVRPLRSRTLATSPLRMSSIRKSTLQESPSTTRAIMARRAKHAQAGASHDFMTHLDMVLPMQPGGKKKKKLGALKNRRIEAAGEDGGPRSPLSAESPTSGYGHQAVFPGGK